MELASDDVEDDDVGHPVYGRRWRWRMRVRPLILLDLRDAPTLARTEIDPLRLRRQSHIRLTDGEYAELRGLILGQAEEQTAL